MNEHSPMKFPEPNRLLFCIGRDRNSEFACSGMMIPFDYGRGARFFIKRDDGRFEQDRDTWNHVKSWDYIAEQ